jgi:hypothetical protein
MARPFNGVINIDMEDSVPDWGRTRSRRLRRARRMSWTSTMLAFPRWSRRHDGPGVTRSSGMGSLPIAVMDRGEDGSSAMHIGG